MFEAFKQWVHLPTGLLYNSEGISLPLFQPRSEPALEEFTINEHLVVRASSLPQDTHHL